MRLPVAHLNLCRVACKVVSLKAAGDGRVFLLHLYVETYTMPLKSATRAPTTFLGQPGC